MTFDFNVKAMKTEATILSEFLSVEKATIEQILRSEERNKSKRARLSESQLGIRIES